MFSWYVQPYVGAPSAVSGISRTDSNAKKACLAAWHEIKKERLAQSKEAK